MRRNIRTTLLFIIAVIGASWVSVGAQDKQSTPVESRNQVVLSSESTTIRIADPNETIAVNGRVMKVADLVEALSLDRNNATHHGSRQPLREDRMTWAFPCPLGELKP